jgi:homoserine kinase type II
MVHDLDALLDGWSLTRPRFVRSAEAGTNNQSFLVDTPTGHFFLRLYQNTADPIRLHYEFAVLEQLAQVRLPFAVPAPIPTRTGEAFVIWSQSKPDRLAALFPLIPGRPPRLGDPSEAFLSGVALGQLDKALAKVSLPTELVPLGSYGELLTGPQSHKLIGDAIGQLSLETRQRRALERIFTRLRETVPGLYANLPRQTIHGDIARSNLLVEAGRVTGVLDFEFAGWDLRALDLACGLRSLGSELWDADEVWPVLRALICGYLQEIALTPAEIQAVPTLLRLSHAAIVLHRFERFQKGLADEAAVTARAQAMLDRDIWLQGHGGELVAILANTSTDSCHTQKIPLEDGPCTAFGVTSSSTPSRQMHHRS